MSEPRKLTYDDGYREGVAAGKASYQGAAIVALRRAREVNEPPSRISYLLEALVFALLDSTRARDEQ